MKTELLSVGIDIGTTTTQVVFSRLTLANVAPAFSVPRIEIVGKRVVYEGAIHLTPLSSENRLDGEALRRIVEGEFGKAGYAPADTDTGAVIITGEAVRKENARLVLEMASGMAGDFVVASAGPDIESIIAGKGSGAQKHSRENGCVTANLDIGGGTTNIAVFSSGDIVATGCYDIGGRLIRLSRDGTVEYVSDKAALVARHAGVAVRPGEKAHPGTIARVASGMNTLLKEALGLAPRTDLLRAVRTPGASDLTLAVPIDAIAFSGGVADCIYRPVRDDFAYGDMGVLLGRAIAAGRLRTAFRQCEPGETIRATVIGAGSYATTVSGSTIGYAENVLPRKSLLAIALPPPGEEKLYRGEADSLKERLALSDAGGGMVLALRGKADPAYRELQLAAECIARATETRLDFGEPLFVAVERDMGKALALCLEKSLAGRRPVVCIDGISVSDGDYLDMGAPVMDGVAIPVVVKTLVFG